MRDKIVLITGATSGIGKATALNLARRGATIIIVSRNREKGELTQYEIINLSDNPNIYLLQADLSVKSDIIELSESFKNIFPRLDILINNAGMLGMPRRTESQDGYELTVATNYFSAFLLTNLLIDTLSKSEDPRIINVISGLYRYSNLDWKDLMMKYRYMPIVCYGRSKLMLAMFTLELADRLKEKKISVNAVDPGSVYTNIAKNYPKLFKVFYSLSEPFLRTPEKGAETIVYLSANKKIGDLTGKIFKNKMLQKPGKYIKKKERRQRLWDETLDILKLDSALNL